jgi:hypothetical protein
MLFSDSKWDDYLEALQSGFKLSTYFDYSAECIDSTTELLDDLFLLYTNRTTDGATWYEQMFFMGYSTSEHFGPYVYNCYLFWADVKDYIKTRKETFIDFSDVYTSFLFNLLAESL